MAATTTTTNIINGFRIIYDGGIGGSGASIRVLGPRGEFVSATGVPDFIDSARGIQESVKGVNEEITRTQQDIASDNKLYAAQKAIFDNPMSTPAQKADAQSRMTGILSVIEENKARIVGLNAVIASLNSSGATTLDKARDVQPTPPTPPPPPAPPPAANAAPTGNVAATTGNAAPTTSTGAATKAPLTGAANDDSGAKQANPAGSNGAPPSGPAIDDKAAKQAETGSPSSDSATAPTLRKEPSKTQPPGKRLKNPLGYLSSYTYQLSLYMITPDAYEAFIASGRRTIDALNKATRSQNGGGAFLVAQSGGINNEQEDRAPGFAFDYSIDNLSFRNSTNGKDNQTATNTTDIKFNITEPYGFSFISNLKRAQDALQKYSGKKVLLPSNPAKQFFILGIRFFGYDESGRIMKGNEVFEGNTLDPNASGNGALFERYYDIIITKLKFKIDGNAVVYSIEAQSTPPKITMTTKRGVVDDKVVLNVSTVKEAFTQLTDALNKRQRDLAAKTNKPELFNTYSIEFVGDAETVIGYAKMVSPADLDKFKWPGSGAKNTGQSNDKTATKSNTPSNTKRELTIDSGAMIPGAINTIITQSQFLEQGLKTVYSTALEPPKDKKAMPEVDQNTKKVLKWYNCSSQISNAKWNPAITDWVYDIKYIIQTYETPVIDSAYKNITTKYYGPHKRYDYWYTGKNSEIISYTQELDNAFFTVVLTPPDEKGDSTENKSDQAEADEAKEDTGKPSTVMGTNSNVTAGNRIGGAATVAQDSYLTSLYDPAKQAEAKITILGDPDFIMYDSSVVVKEGDTQTTKTVTESQVYEKFYGPDGYTVNPNGGQVFIEIDFKEAVDYSSDGSSIASPTGGAGISGEPGTLSINESILFWKYPDDIAKLVKGISYMVIAVTSTFSGGSFKQTLECSINDFAQSGKTNKDEGREKENNSTAGTTPPATGPVATGATPKNSNTTLADSGLKPDSAVSAALSKYDNTLVPLNSVNTSELLAQVSVPTNIGPVVDDDAASFNTLYPDNPLAPGAGRETVKGTLPNTTTDYIRGTLPGDIQGFAGVELPGSSPIVRGVQLPGAPSLIRGTI